jgi:phosphomannomutase
MSMQPLTCFKAYDVRGELGVDFDTDIAYRIGRSIAQHFRAKKIVIGRDARKTSPELAAAVAHGINDCGADVLDLGLCGSEEMYWAVTEIGACAGIEVTASHNPINYNGIKIVKSGSRPLDSIKDFEKIKILAESAAWTHGPIRGTIMSINV